MVRYSSALAEWASASNNPAMKRRSFNEPVSVRLLGRGLLLLGLGQQLGRQGHADASRRTSLQMRSSTSRGS